MSSALTPEAVAATARTAGLDFPPAVAERIAVALSPALAAFVPVRDALAFDLEPAAFVAVQKPAADREGGK